MSEALRSSQFYQILQDYSDWFSQVLRAAFFPEKILRQDIEPPDSLRERLGEVLHSDHLSEQIISDTLTRQQILHDHVSVMLASQGKPDIQAFDSFLDLYEDFTRRIARFDVDTLLYGYGVDNITGLRSSNVIISDLERELERRSRRGHPFSIVLCQIDGPLNTKIPEQLKKASDAIRFCMRSFDDAYLSGKNEILVSLKQTDSSGALKFVERLKFVLNEKKADFTMSYCAAEPMPGDNLEQLITNVRADLQNISADGVNEAGQYEEISPLQRFIRTMSNETRQE